MGILKLAADAFDSAFNAFKAANPTANRNQKRKFVAALVTRGQEWLARFDAQENRAAADFAATRPAQFQTYVDTLAEPTLDAAPANDPVP